MTNLIISDMDGTFLRDDKSYDISLFEKVFSKIQSCGDIFIVATGNHILRAKEIFPQYPNIPIISDKGGVVLDGMEICFQESIHVDKITLLVETLLNKNLPIVSCVFCGTSKFYVLKDFYDSLNIKTYFFKKKTIKIDSLEMLPFRTQKIYLTCTPVYVEFIADILADQLSFSLNILPSGFRSIDIVNVGVDKGSTLKKLKEQYIGDNRTLVFGNELNDLPLFSVVYYKIAVENSHEKLLEIADEIIGSNHQQGVLKKLETLYQ